jgi:NitT/TauT family transport system substrate-binding protein
MTRIIRRLAALAVVLAAVVPLALPAPASAQTKLKMVLNWKYQGPQGWFFSPRTAAISKTTAST